MPIPDFRVTLDLHSLTSEARASPCSYIPTHAVQDKFLCDQFNRRSDEEVGEAGVKNLSPEFAWNKRAQAPCADITQEMYRSKRHIGPHQVRNSGTIRLNFRVHDFSGGHSGVVNSNGLTINFNPQQSIGNRIRCTGNVFLRASKLRNRREMTLLSSGPRI